MSRLDPNRFENVFLTADTHFDHFNIIRYCNRPFVTSEEMNETMIQRWNETVGENDLVIHLGDFCFGHPQKFADRLNGTLSLVKGNHDRKFYKWFKYRTLYNEMSIGRFNVLIRHHPAGKRFRSGFDPKRHHFCICGHVHEKWLWDYLSFNVGVDMHNFRPISLQKVEKHLEDRKKFLQNFKTRPYFSI